MKTTFEANTPVVGSQLFLFPLKSSKNNCRWINSLCPRRTGNRDLAGVGVEGKGARLSVDCCRSRTPGQRVPTDHTIKAHPKEDGVPRTEIVASTATPFASVITVTGSG